MNITAAFSWGMPISTMISGAQNGLLRLIYHTIVEHDRTDLPAEYREVNVQKSSRKTGKAFLFA